MQNTVIYKPYQRLELGWIRSWIIMIQNTINAKELIWQLFRRDFLMSYKKSFIGIGWIFISPIVGIVSWVFMNQAGILSPGDVGIPYPAYVLLGSTVWGLFMGLYASAGGTLNAGNGFINQVNYPHEALLFKQLLQQLVAFSITFVVNLIVLLLFGINPSIIGIILLPLAILPLLFLATAIGLIISLVSVVATDISKMVDTALGYVIFITPVIYAKEIENDFLQTVVNYNPLTYLVGGVRDLIVYGRINDFDIFVALSCVAFVAFLISLRLFYVSEIKVIERMF